MEAALHLPGFKLSSIEEFFFGTCTLDQAQGDDRLTPHLVSQSPKGCYGCTYPDQEQVLRPVRNSISKGRSQRTRHFDRITHLDRLEAAALPGSHRQLELAVCNSTSTMGY